jgi:UDP-3-O-[3-hydroxymyristoyl] glucosamine N-acyltransferase
VKRTAGQLAALVRGELEGDPELLVWAVNGLETATAGHVSFYANPKYKKALATTNASVVLVGPDAPSREGRTSIRVPNPHLAFARVATEFHPPRRHAPGVSPGAHLDAEATVDPSATIMAGATVSKGAVIGARAVLYPGVFIGEFARVGDDSVLSANVSVLEHCIVGARCILHPSCVVGADGFGFAFDPEAPAHVKIPQAGIVRIEDDVEIGACSCIDRATTGETVIGRGAKLDNLVQVGHNSTVGPMSILCAQVGLSGTSELGTGVMLAGQVGVAGHLRIGDLVKVAGQAGIIGDVADGATMMGAPAFSQRDYLRSYAVFSRLPELNRELSSLRKRLEALEQKKP